MEFNEVINTFKKCEDAASVYVLLEDKKLALALSAWPNVPIKFTGLGVCASFDPVEQWEWLWKRSKVDLVTFALILGCSPEQAKDVAARLIGLHLVYPDSSVNNFARQYLNALVAERLSKASKRLPKAPAS